MKRARTMPEPDTKDRCSRCGKAIPRSAIAYGFRDEVYGRDLRVDGRCAMVLREMAGYREAS